MNKSLYLRTITIIVLVLFSSLIAFSYFSDRYLTDYFTKEMAASQIKRLEVMDTLTNNIFENYRNEVINLVTDSEFKKIISYDRYDDLKKNPNSIFLASNFSNTINNVSIVLNYFQPNQVKIHSLLL